MFPIALNLTRISVLLAGSGELFTRRHAQLKDYGATSVTLIEGREPTAEEIGAHPVILVAGFPREVSERIAGAARLAGKLVNVEDVNDLCDFYFTANVRRGELIIAVSTCGASPTLARKIRDVIASRFGEEWASRLREIATLRKAWKEQGAGMKESVEKTEQLLVEKGWLEEDKAA